MQSNRAIWKFMSGQVHAGLVYPANSCGLDCSVERFHDFSGARHHVCNRKQGWRMAVYRPSELHLVKIKDTVVFRFRSPMPTTTTPAAMIIETPWIDKDRSLWVR